MAGFCQGLIHLPSLHREVDWVDEDELARRRSTLNVDGSIVRQASVRHEPIILEIVGCMGLESKQRKSVDPYCKVKVYDLENSLFKEVHRTSTIYSDGNPIWTVKSKALCMVQIPVQNKSKEPGKDTVVVDVCHSNTLLGRCSVLFSDVLRYSRTEDRVEVCLKVGNDQKQNGAILALRFRRASADDLTFLHKLAKLDASEIQKSAIAPMLNPAIPLHENDRKVGADINFQRVQTKSMFQRYVKKDKDGTPLFRILPHPDPDRPAETEWMSGAAIECATYQPSKKWITAGTGQAGTLYVEVLGCNKLPQMDSQLSGSGNLTDAFCAMTFEDNFVRTEVIWDSLNPRWLPWTTRAFMFSIRHPASLLCLSVFDYDELPLDAHDPVGRVVVRLSNYRANTTYTLHLPIQDDSSDHTHLDMPFNDDGSAMSDHPRGIIILRLRLEWEDEIRIMKKFIVPPPRYIINVDNDKSYQVLRYTTRGAAYMEEASLASVKLLANEIMSYGKGVFFGLDVILGILLWRGRWQLSKKWSVWCPVHSIALLAFLASLVERPDMAVPIFLYAITWILLSINVYASRHPYPWKRVRSSFETNMMIIFGRRSLLSSSCLGECTEIPSYEGVSEGALCERLDAVKASRMSALLNCVLNFGLQVANIYSKAGDDLIETTSKSYSWNLFGNQLKLVHLPLKMVCLSLRSGRDFVSWKGNYTAVFTTNCLMLGTAWLILPINMLLLWAARLVVWTLFGPWMKLVDIVYFRPWYETEQELKQRIRDGRATEAAGLPNLAELLESEKYCKLRDTLTLVGRKRAEQKYKLRDMRILLFGSYSEEIPSTDNSRYPNIPLPQSTAIRNEWISPPSSGTCRGYHIPGQLLSGNIIHERDRGISGNDTNGDDLQ